MMETIFARKDCYQVATPGRSSLTRLIIASTTSGSEYTSDSSATDSDRSLTSTPLTENLVLLSHSKFDGEKENSKQKTDKHEGCCELAALCTTKVTFLYCPKPDHSSLRNTRSFVRSPCIDKFPRVMPPVDEDEDEEDENESSDHYDEDEFDTDDETETQDVEDIAFDNI